MKSVSNSKPGALTRFLPLSASLFLLAFPSLTYGLIETAETTDLKVALDSTTGVLTVTDKGSPDVVWNQDTTVVGYHLQTSTFVQNSPSEFTCTIIGPTNTYGIHLTVDVPPAKSFHLTVTPNTVLTTDPYPFVSLPLYPFFFTGTNVTDPWYYVQNNGGEGTLLGINDTTLRGRGGWSGSQPWWGVTNLTQAMMARLDTFAQLQNPTANGDPSAYKIPIEIEYSFYRTGGYVGLAKAYRSYFLLHNSLSKLSSRVGLKGDLSYLKDGTYAYFWDYETDTESVSSAMKAQGLDRVIAMFSLHEDQDRLNAATLDYLGNTGSRWVGGIYRTPTPNLFQLFPSYMGSWVNDLLLHRVTETALLTNYTQGDWSTLDTDYSEPQWKTGNTDDNRGLPYLAGKYGTNLRVIYQDTLPQQLGPSIQGPTYLQTIQDNLTGRQKILDDTLTAGFLGGSGEGISAFWTIPHLDYWEGGMEESIYGDIDRHPNTEFGYEFASDTFVPPGTGRNTRTWKDQESDCLQEHVRIPLLALQWHDYAAETWNWRNSTFVVDSLSWKKDLFNILYCGMPMWHISYDLWMNHSAAYIASYKKLLPVRQANGFAEMTDHHWLNNDINSEIQYTDWDNGNRVVVNFGGAGGTGDDYPYSDGTYSGTIPSRGYEMFPDSTPPATVPSFTATAGNTQVTLNWTLPPDGDLVSVRIRRSTNTYPTWTTGNEIHSGRDTTWTDTGRTNGQTYYYSAFTVDGAGNHSAAVHASAAPHL